MVAAVAGKFDRVLGMLVYLLRKARETLDFSLILRKKKYCASAATPYTVQFCLFSRCLSRFKGMVHRLRQREKRQNCTVYGVAADAQYFFFLKTVKLSSNSCNHGNGPLFEY
jgi:hypothetical protein